MRGLCSGVHCKPHPILAFTSTAEESVAMPRDDYNYSEFGSSPNEFMEFAEHAPKVTMRAPSFPLEDLATGQLVQMSELWKNGVAVIEFGSFT
jgi:hypothetical protein